MQAGAEPRTDTPAPEGAARTAGERPGSDPSPVPSLGSPFKTGWRHLSLEVGVTDPILLRTCLMPPSACCWPRARLSPPAAGPSWGETTGRAAGPPQGTPPLLLGTGAPCPGQHPPRLALACRARPCHGQSSCRRQWEPGGSAWPSPRPWPLSIQDTPQAERGALGGHPEHVSASHPPAWEWGLLWHGGPDRRSWSPTPQGAACIARRQVTGR